jgi:cytoskeletal protein RodZ
MGELGELLRSTRQQRGLSIKQAEETTRIRQRHLEALENEDFAEMPAPVYTRAFLRTYARYLGLDGDEMVEQFDHYRPIRSFRRSRPTRQRSVSTRAWHGPDVRTSAVAGVLLLMAAGLAYFFHQYSEFVADSATTGDLTTPLPAFLTPTAGLQVLPSTTPPLAVVPLPTVTPVPLAPTAAILPFTATPLPPTAAPPAPTSTTQPTATRVTGVALTATMAQASWMRIVLDGNTAFTGTVPAGASRSWKAQRFVTIRATNAGGVIVTINGKDEGPLGPIGQVAERTYRATSEASPTSGTPKTR